MNDYKGNGGTYGYGILTSPGASLDGPIVPTKSRSGKSRRLTDITDGTANTILVGEKMLWPEAFKGTSYCSDDQGYTDGWDNDTIGLAKSQGGATGPAVPPISIKRSGTDIGSNCDPTFGSVHASWLCVFCDGSVHSVDFSIDPLNWLKLCSINDGTPLDSGGWN
jgi:hypothetical protein